MVTSRQGGMYTGSLGGSLVPALAVVVDVFRCCSKMKLIKRLQLSCGHFNSQYARLEVALVHVHAAPNVKDSCTIDPMEFWDRHKLIYL